MSALLETWQISHRMNEYLLSGIKEEHSADVSLAKGRSVGLQFAHIHNVRLMWTKVAAPDIDKTLSKIDTEKPITKKILLDAFIHYTPEWMRRSLIRFYLAIWFTASINSQMVSVTLSINSGERCS